MRTPERTSATALVPPTMSAAAVSTAWTPSPEASAACTGMLCACGLTHLLRSFSNRSHVRTGDDGPLTGRHRTATSFGDLAQSCRVLPGELPALQPPRPVAGDLTGPVHARVAAEAEHVLRRDDGERRGRCGRELDQPPVRLARIEAGSLSRALSE